MDIGRHQVLQGVVHAAVPGQRKLPREYRGGDAEPEMAPAVARAGMAAVQVALVDQRDLRVRKSQGQRRPAARLARGGVVPGSTWRNGLTTTSANTPSVA